MPGEVITGHAEYETNCDNCHTKLRKGEQRALCLDCHEMIAHDIDTKQGFHGLTTKILEVDCKACHTEHKGRKADIVQLDKDNFPHSDTNFPLKGAHTQVPCINCHQADKKYREAPNECFDCHREDDYHTGGLGEQCDDCHTQNAWQESQFDHDTTDFLLKGKHQQVNCSGCHPDERYKPTPKDCYSCHQLNDAHGGNFGTKCDKCHNSKGWEKSVFDHNQDTNYKLTGSHKKLKCEQCHLEPVFKTKPSSECYSCHKNDDAHLGKNGRQCSNCHNYDSWTKATFDHDNKTSFPLRGAHVQLRCLDCHKGKISEEKLEPVCYSCHQADDVHQKQLGENCARCHNEQAWSEQITFDHDLSRFPLIGQHAITSCEECHLQLNFKTAAIECSSCHAKDDIHAKRLSKACERCHNPNGWRLWRFEHDTETNFKLDGKHKDLDCLSCHRKAVEQEFEQPQSCYSCHLKDDLHRGQYGRFCERCHITESFGDIQIGL